MLGASQPNTSNPMTTPTQPGSAPLMTAVKQPVGTTGSGSAGAPKGLKETKKIFGVDRRSLLTVLGLTLFFVVAMAGVVVSLRQYFNRGAVTPNAPESQPQADVVKENTCTLSFEVTEETTEYVCDSDCTTDNQCQTANANFSCENNKCRLTTNPTSATCSPPDTVYRCDSDCTDDSQCSDVNSAYTCDDTTNKCRLATNPTSTSCEEDTTTYACNSDCSSDEQCQRADNDFICSNNKCRLETNTSSESCQPATVQCDSACTSNAQCQTANTNYICTDEGRCRLDTNTTSASCQPTEEDTYACNSECTSNAQCQLANGSYICSNNRCRLETNVSSTSCQPGTTTTTVGCNETCATNSDCSNGSHICYENKCRLESAPENATCRTSTTTTEVTTPKGGTPEQPALPEELPKTGPEDWSNWLKAGLAALGIGAVLLLLL